MVTTVPLSGKQTSHQHHQPDIADIKEMLNIVQAIEQSLTALKQMLEHLQRESLPETRGETFSLYGIFAHTDVTWEDFQRAKRSWLPKAEEV
ncbi:MAG: hypothetical protein ACPLYD_04925 [Anaerolineae bacterium]|jgi:hypothetical protein